MELCLVPTSELPLLARAWTRTGAGQCTYGLHFPIPATGMPTLLLLPFEFCNKLPRGQRSTVDEGTVLSGILANLWRWLPLLDIPLAACTSPIKALVMTCSVSGSLDSQDWEPLGAGAKTAGFSLCPESLAQSQARDGAQTYR